MLSPAAAPSTTARTRIAPAPRIGSALIVGRAACGHDIWLLNETPELIKVSLSPPHVTAVRLHRLELEDEPWGLACLTDGTLWTLVSPRTLGRVQPDGTIVERVRFRLPRIALFGWGERILFEQMPTVAGAPILVSGVPRAPLEAKPWPGLKGRADPKPEVRLTRNLLACGLGLGASLPCWFPDESEITVSDGASVRRIPIPSARARDTDPRTPIWDVALVPPAGLWALTTVRGTKPATGARLVRADWRGVESRRVEGGWTARLILAASPRACWLLTGTGELMEITSP